MGVVVVIEPGTGKLRNSIGDIWKGKRHIAAPLHKLFVQRMQDLLPLVDRQRTREGIRVYFSSNLAGNSSQRKNMKWHSQDRGMKRIWRSDAVCSNKFLIDGSKRLKRVQLIHVKDEHKSESRSYRNVYVVVMKSKRTTQRNRYNTSIRRMN